MVTNLSERFVTLVISVLLSNKIRKCQFRTRNTHIKCTLSLIMLSSINTGVFLTFIFLNLCTYCIQVEYIYVCKRNVDLVSICGIYLKSYVHMYMYLHNLALLIYKLSLIYIFCCPYWCCLYNNTHYHEEVTYKSYMTIFN